MRTGNLFRLFLSLGALLALPLTLTAADRPNVIIFLVDDMGLMDTSVPFLTDDDGTPVRHPLNDYYRTPSMERLAAKGIRFSDFYAHSVCSPSRISILNGQNSARHSTTQWINPSKKNGGPEKWNWEGLTSADFTLPRFMKQQGYKTIFIGKAHFGPLDHEGSDPLNLGFDVNIGGNSWGRPASYYGRDHYGNLPKFETHQIPHLERYYKDDVFLTEALTQEALSEIDKSLSEGQPFFLQLSHYALHTPFQPDPRFEGNYDSRGKGNRAYATLVEGMDKSLGDLMDHLEAKGVASDTLILFLGDNGSDAPGPPDKIASSAPLRGKKGTHWEGGTRVPFIAAWGAEDTGKPWQKRLPIPSGTVTTQMGVCYDLLPTISGLLEAPLPEEHVVDGQDLGQRLLGQTDQSYRDVFLTHFPHGHRSNHFTSLRLDNWKLIYDYQPNTGEPRYHLYDLSNDPSESNNLAQSNPEKLKTMLVAMEDELQSTGALSPETKDGEVLELIIP